MDNTIGARKPLSWRDHVGQLITLATAVVAILRITLVSRGDLVTARAIVQHVSIPTILLDALLSVVVIAFGGVMVITLRLLPVWWRSRRLTMTVVMLAVVISGAYLLPVAIALGVLGYGLVSLVARAVRRIRRKPRTTKENNLDEAQYRDALTAFGGMLVIIVVLTGTPWQPLEEVRTQDGRTQIGYVLRDTPGTTLLTADRHSVLYLSSPIVDRHLCIEDEGILPNWLNEPIATAFTETSYAVCKGETSE